MIRNEIYGVPRSGNCPLTRWGRDERGTALSQAPQYVVPSQPVWRTQGQQI